MMSPFPLTRTASFSPLLSFTRAPSLSVVRVLGKPSPSSPSASATLADFVCCRLENIPLPFQFPQDLIFPSSELVVLPSPFQFRRSMRLFPTLDRKLSFFPSLFLFFGPPSFLVTSAEASPPSGEKTVLFLWPLQETGPSAFPILPCCEEGESPFPCSM